jgi:hypothetical protein
MAKGIVLNFVDADPGVDDSNIVLRAKVLFVGATVPGSPVIDMGPQENGVPIALNIGTMSATAYSNAVEDALLARAVQLGFTLARTDVLLPTYSRGTV